MENKSYEQFLEDLTRKIRAKHDEIIDDFAITYAAELCSLNKEFSLDDICLIEQEPHLREGCVTRRYWFEFKPKFEDLED